MEERQDSRGYAPSTSKVRKVQDLAVCSIPVGKTSGLRMGSPPGPGRMYSPPNPCRSAPSSRSVRLRNRYFDNEDIPETLFN
jgi:hypothetical protein